MSTVTLSPLNRNTASLASLLQAVSYLSLSLLVALSPDSDILLAWKKECHKITSYFLYCLFCGAKILLWTEIKQDSHGQLTWRKTFWSGELKKKPSRTRQKTNRNQKNPLPTLSNNTKCVVEIKRQSNLTSKTETQVSQHIISAHLSHRLPFNCFFLSTFY